MKNRFTANMMFFVHNVVAHPLAEITHWLGFIIPPLRVFGNWFHNITFPSWEDEENRA